LFAFLQQLHKEKCSILSAPLASSNKFVLRFVCPAPKEKVWKNTFGIKKVEMLTDDNFIDSGAN